LNISTATDTDIQEWNAFVHSHPLGSAYHLYAWGQAIAQSYGHKPIYLIARQDEKVVGVLPLIHLKFSFFLNELVALPFCDVGGCLCVNSKVESQFLVEAVQRGKNFNAKNLELRGSIQNAVGRDVGFSPAKSEKVRMLLSLPDSSEKLLTCFKSKLRSQISKSEKNGMVFRWAGEDGVDSFYEVFCRNMRDLGSPVHSKRFFRAIMENYGDNARIGLVTFEKQCVGAGLILSTDKQTSIPWASTLRKYNRLAPNMLLYWNCLKYAADNNKEVFDFGRSTENGGTFRFKKQWGASPVPLPWYSFSPNPLPSSEDAGRRSKRDKVAAIWMKMPLPLANYFGPKLRKYINL